MRVSVASGLAITVVLALGFWTAQGPQARAQQTPQTRSQGEGAAAPAVKQTSREQFDRWMAQVSNWGRWGKDDQLGALNLITPAIRRKAAALVKTGTSLSLARPAVADAAAETRKQSGKAPGDAPGGLGNFFGASQPPNVVDLYVMERQEVEYHGGRFTHVDAFCHAMHGGKIYGGLDYKATVTPEGGCAKMGIAAMKGGVVTRGLLLDLPGVQVFPQDIEAWEKRTGIRIGPGDALLLRSGKPAQKTGGWDPSIGPFLRARDVAILGSDFYQEGGSVPGVFLPIHSLTLYALGVHLFDNLDLDALAETATRLKRWEFLLMAAPPPITNGAGSLINPIAVF
jgi:kynurenine formamidase